MGRGNENIGSALDFRLLGRNYSGYYVGMNAIPSTATIIFGVMAGQLILRTTDAGGPAASSCCRLAGVWVGPRPQPVVPVDQAHLDAELRYFAGGCTTLMLLAFYWTIEVKGWKKWSFPLVVVGMNSIAAYVLGNAFGGWFRSFSGGLDCRAEGTRWGPPGFPSCKTLLFALAAWVVLYWLYRRKIFFKL